jgi:long-subunit fatty acid transport protein
MPYQLDYMNYQQTTHLSGSGVNLKIGMTVRPLPWLRIGIAYHTPTAYSLSLRYSADMWSETYSAGDNPDGYDIDKDGYMYDYVESPEWEDAGEYSWNYRSPSRLMVGAAVTIAQRVILSADYERSWYQKMRLTSSPISNLDYTSTIQEQFRGSNTLRVGAEFRALPFMDIRAGYIFSDGGLQNGDQIFTHPLISRENYITAGLGFKLGNMTYLDFAYQYNKRERTWYQSFYAVDAFDPELNIESVPVRTNSYRHLAVLTLGFRF